MKRISGLLLLALVAPVPAAHAQSGKWPERPVRVIIVFPPGGSNDVTARIVFAKMNEKKVS